MYTILTDYNIQAHNTFRMNVSCRYWIEYTEASDLPAIFSALPTERFKAVGQGSNLLFLADYPGTILHSRILTVESMAGDDGYTLICAGAGVKMDELILSTCASGLWGLENLSGIPGEVGASAVQNVGAYGVEAKDIIHAVECYDTVEHRFVTLTNQDCQFAYRYSMFKSSEYSGRFIVTHVTFRLTSAGRPVLDYGNLHKYFADSSAISPMAIRDKILEIREAKLPSVELVGSAGSFFKNPILNKEQYVMFRQRVVSALGPDAEPPHFEVENGIKLSAAWLIDKAGLKGYTEDNAATWSAQPLVIVNATGHATPRNIVALEETIITKVHDTFGVTLSPEVEHII